MENKYNKKEKNIAFIDGQNLHLGVSENKWTIDHYKFRIYLKDKYHVTEAYYFLGYTIYEERELYKNLQKAGFIVIFKKHNLNLLTQKKGNVDSDIIFETMKNLIDNKDFDKILLVSGDGDYKKLIDYLIVKNKFIKILFPNRKFTSSLYKDLSNKFFSYLEEKDIRRKIEYFRLDKKKRVP